MGFTAQEEGIMSENEIRLIRAIRSAPNPEKMMTYIEGLLFNPQKFQEALETLFAQQVSWF